MGTNSDGDGQKQLDVIADEIFFTSLKDAGVGFYASEERETIETLNEDGDLGGSHRPFRRIV